MEDDGVFLYVTFRQPHFMEPLLNPDGLWDLSMQVLGAQGSFNYYGYIIRKRKAVLAPESDAHPPEPALEGE